MIQKQSFNFMKKLLIIILLFESFVSAAFAIRDSLGGFQYALVQAPDGKEWESPERLALNKEQPRATFFPLPTLSPPGKFCRSIALIG